MKKVILFICIFIIFIFVGNFSNIKETIGFINQKAYLKAMVYFGNYILSVIAVVLLILNKYTRFIFFLLILITITIELGYRNLSSFGFGYDDALLIIQEFDSPLAKEAIITYFPFFIKSFFIAVCIIICLYFFTKKIKSKKRDVILGSLLLIVSFLISYKILSISNGVRVAYISIIKDPLLLYYAATHKLYIGPRKSVFIKPINNLNIKHVIYIVDESVRGDFLSLNGFEKLTTPFLESIKDKLFNYGVASSGGICSSYSNAILLTGIQPNQLVDTKELARKQPLIFQYAKKAGYKTSFFDMQNSREKPNNFFQPTDWQYIDYSFFIGEDYKKLHKTYQKDLIGLKKLKEYVLKHKNEKTFTYFVKMGCHFSYTDKYPKDQEIFKPVLEDSGWGEWDLNIKSRFLNTYCNAIFWEVDNFFKNLVEDLNDTETLIIYTSDHAQNLIDDLNIKQTHCVKGPAPSVIAEVPLFMLPMNENVRNYINQLYIDNYNKASHFNIFGTILYLMGYDKKEINKYYGRILFDNLSEQNRIFTSGDIFGRSIFYKNIFRLNNNEKGN